MILWIKEINGMVDDVTRDGSQENAEAGSDRSMSPPVSGDAGPKGGSKAESSPHQPQQSTSQEQTSYDKPGWFRTKVSEANFAEWVMAFLTLVIAGTTIAYTVYARRQWKEMHDSGSDTHALALAARDQAGEAKIQAEAAGKQVAGILESNKINKSAFDRAYRPYIGIDSIAIFYGVPKTPLSTNGVAHMPTDETMAMSFQVQIRNFGPVPGDNFEVNWKVFLDGIELPKMQKTPDAPSTLFPGQTVILDGAIASDTYKAVEAKRTILSYRLSANYGGPQGHTKYCANGDYSPDVHNFLVIGKKCP